MTAIVMELRPEDVAEAAQLLDVEHAAVWAVVEVESAQRPFLDDGRPVILFEAHQFSELTGGRFDGSHPRLSSPRWDRSLYGAPGNHQWRRLEQAMELDRIAALKACSWGAFQIMGFNHGLAGFGDVETFVAAMRSGLGAQVKAFAAFINSDPAMASALRERRWAGFARRYNGPGYRENRYDEKLRDAYVNARRMGWRKVQKALNDRGADPALAVDGLFGPMSRTAWRAVINRAPLNTPEAALEALGLGPFG